MLTWIDASNKYEQIQKAHFGDWEITVVNFSTGGILAWVKNPSLGITAPTLFKRSYPMGMTIDEAKARFLNEFKDFIQEQESYWTDIHYALWRAENWNWIEEEGLDNVF